MSISVKSEVLYLEPALCRIIVSRSNYANKIPHNLCLAGMGKKNRYFKV